VSQTERHDVDVKPAYEAYDWLSVGSGVAGLAGALVAALAGRRVLVVEKVDRLGGQTAYSYGALFGAVGSMQDDGPTEDAGRVSCRRSSTGVTTATAITTTSWPKRSAGCERPSATPSWCRCD
jgi:predicted oxidoreductase